MHIKKKTLESGLKCSHLHEKPLYKHIPIYESAKVFAYEVNFAKAGTMKEFCNKHL